MQEVSLLAAFLAGLVSFLAPCIFPLIPGFLSYLGGASIREAESKRKEVFLNSVFFVLGFSLVFSLLGVLLNTLLESVAYDAQVWLSKIGGALIIFFGLYLVGIFKIPFLEREHKFSVKTKTRSKYFTSFLFGLAFAAGWTPCVGPALGIILGLAATQPGSAFILLFFYSLGLGLPFLAVGMFVSRADQFIKNNTKKFQNLSVFFGGLLVVLGILVFTQTLNIIANWDFLSNFLPW